jgi:hypothetical protein
VAAVCPNPAHCLRCHREGHQAQNCKRSRSSDTVDPPRQLQKPLTSDAVVVLHPRKGDLALQAPTTQPHRGLSPKQQPSVASLGEHRTPSSQGPLATPEGSPSRHVLSSLPPSWATSFSSSTTGRRRTMSSTHHLWRVQSSPFASTAGVVSPGRSSSLYATKF